MNLAVGWAVVWWGVGGSGGGSGGGGGELGCWVECGWGGGRTGCDSSAEGFNFWCCWDCWEDCWVILADALGTLGGLGLWL